MMHDFLTLLLSPFGFEILPFGEMCTQITNLNAWYQLFDLRVLVPWLFYFAFAWGMLYICFILPFRFFKRWIKAPDKKGKR